MAELLTDIAAAVVGKTASSVAEKAKRTDVPFAASIDGFDEGEWDGPREVRLLTIKFENFPPEMTLWKVSMENFQIADIKRGHATIGGVGVLLDPIIPPSEGEWKNEMLDFVSNIHASPDGTVSVSYLVRPIGAVNRIFIEVLAEGPFNPVLTKIDHLWL